MTPSRRFTFSVLYSLTLVCGRNAAALARLFRRLVAVDVRWLPVTLIALAGVVACWLPMRLISLATFSACRALADGGASA